ncbi:MAG: N-acetylmuramic acid 6-phosphate etherase [Bacteroidetes bacterium]|nr:N-acetylmuramic acid 6-phosphate etherase [Rhodothermia bacterium]MCS7154246.1 N-acetylmuramic acid 6-phosphate etherase [Bacteroidota bacterium]MCX7906718.1 N-acetylmuramic acid 6-phosphate etherase [Bacteroidota bacterium]MDW8137002.1 N-acetylmuramic acid 6-phosphate etherase [Bacteroidota bacterium]MDW8285127.1 N-acetylmuramic acid 6-phosphate etherase [Bacteroidota bacterium]
MSDRALFEQLQRLLTEQRNPASQHIDLADTEEILRIINAEDHKVPEAVEREIPYIAQAVELVVTAFRAGGRLFYVGAGTSGRIGVQDAAECPPTFGTDPEMVQAIIAGGPEAVFRAQEGAEDRKEDGARAIRERGVCARDVVCGLAASRRTPFVVGAIEEARKLGARTIFVTCNPRHEFDLEVDVAICPVVGPEVIMGSTRMKCGTAQKLVLNMISTAAMIRLGKVYENLMVDLQLTNQKLRQRARRILMMITGVDYETASRALEAASGHVKTALVMLLAGVDAGEARWRLEAAGGVVRRAIAGLNSPSRPEPG